MDSPSPPFSPEGLRILVVDNDDVASKKLEKILKQHKYKVTTCRLTGEAYHMLGENNEGYKFDMVMADANTISDGFEFLRRVSRRMNIPMIMMSKNGETSNVKKGIKYDSCHFLLKPIRVEDVRFIWQHVYHDKFKKVVEQINREEGYDTQTSDTNNNFQEPAMLLSNMHQSIPQEEDAMLPRNTDQGMIINENGGYHNQQAVDVHINPCLEIVPYIPNSPMQCPSNNGYSLHQSNELNMQQCYYYNENDVASAVIQDERATLPMNAPVASQLTAMQQQIDLDDHFLSEVLNAIIFINPPPSLPEIIDFNN